MCYACIYLKKKVLQQWETQWMKENKMPLFWSIICIRTRSGCRSKNHCLNKMQDENVLTEQYKGCFDAYALTPLKNINKSKSRKTKTVDHKDLMKMYCSWTVSGFSKLLSADVLVHHPGRIEKSRLPVSRLMEDSAELWEMRIWTRTLSPPASVSITHNLSFSTPSFTPTLTLHTVIPALVSRGGINQHSPNHLIEPPDVWWSTWNGWINMSQYFREISAEIWTFLSFLLKRTGCWFCTDTCTCADLLIYSSDRHV